MINEMLVQPWQGCVKIVRPVCGTAFFITSSLLLTAKHVLNGLGVGEIVIFRYNEREYEANVLNIAPLTGEIGAFPDVAILQATNFEGKPFVLAEQIPNDRDHLTVFGYAAVSNSCESLTTEVAGRRIEEGCLSGFRLTLKDVNIVPGWSGSPVVREPDNAVVGIVTLTRDPLSDLGGRATPIPFVTDAFDKVRDIIAATKFAGTYPVIAKELQDTFKKPDLSSILTSEAQKKYDRLRALVRAGNNEVALKELQDAQNDVVFAYISEDLRAQYLRMHASLLLAINDDIAGAEQLRDKANGLATEGIAAVILDAKIAMARGRLEDALSILHGDHSDIIMLRATILYQSLRTKEAMDAITVALKTDGSNAELLRLIALIYLVERRRAEARSASALALKFDETSVQVLFAAGVVNWFDAIPDSLIPRLVDLRPEPIHLNLVQRSSAITQALKRSEQYFRRMLDQTYDRALRRTLEIWILGALSMRNDDAATTMALELLSREEPNIGAVLFAIRHNLPLDAEPYLQAIEKADLPNLGDVCDVATALIMMHQGARAEKLLRDHTTRFKTSPHYESFMLMSARAIADQEDYARALAFLDEQPHEEYSASLRDALQNQMADDAGQRDSIKLHLESQYAETGDPIHLLQRIELAMYESDFKYAAKYAETLVQSLPTYAALRVAMVATYNIGQWNDVIRLHSVYIANTDWARTEEMLRLKTLALYHLGSPDAVIAGSELVDSYPTAQNIDVLGGVLVRANDTAAISVLARRLDPGTDANADIFLRFANYLQFDYIPEAQRLWDIAATKKIPPAALGIAIHLAHRLSRNVQTAALFMQIKQYDELETGVMVRTTDQVVEIIREQQTFAGGVNIQYQKGLVPIHLVADRLNIAIIHTHYALPAQNKSRPQLHKTPIYTRSASRWYLNSKLPAVIRPMLDITALLIAQSIGVIHDIEDHFEEILVQSNLGNMVFEMSTDIVISQPDRDAALREVKAMVSGKSIEVINIDESENATTEARLNYHEVALQRDAYVVDFLMIRELPDGQLESKQLEHVGSKALNPRMLAQSLHDEGSITAEQLAQAIKDMGVESEALLGVVPINGHPILLAPTVATFLQLANLLRPLTLSRSVYIIPEDLARIDAEIQENDMRNLLSTQLRVFAEQCRRRIQEKKYLPVAAQQLVQELPETWTASNALLAAITGSLEEGDVVVVEDRCVNRSTIREEGHAVIGLLDLIRVLHEAGRIDIRRYYGLKIQMRQAGLFFIEVDLDEILYHLRDANINDGVIVTTAELTTIRQYIAAVVLMRDQLAHDDGRIDERPMLYMLSETIRQLILCCLDEKSSDGQIRAAWVLENLYIDDLINCEAFLWETNKGYYQTDIGAAILLCKALEL